VGQAGFFTLSAFSFELPAKIAVWRLSCLTPTMDFNILLGNQIIIVIQQHFITGI
jgi:hypothetical protein